VVGLGPGRWLSMYAAYIYLSIPMEERGERTERNGTRSECMHARTRLVGCWPGCVNRGPIPVGTRVAGRREERGERECPVATCRPRVHVLHHACCAAETG
jgi:hypothetical protein